MNKEKIFNLGTWWPSHLKSFELLISSHFLFWSSHDLSKYLLFFIREFMKSSGPNIVATERCVTEPIYFGFELQTGSGSEPDVASSKSCKNDSVSAQTLTQPDHEVGTFLFSNNSILLDLEWGLGEYLLISVHRNESSYLELFDCNILKSIKV